MIKMVNVEIVEERKGRLGRYTITSLFEALYVIISYQFYLMRMIVLFKDIH